MGKRVYRNNYKRHMDNFEMGVGSSVGSKDGRCGGDKIETIVLEQELKEKEKNKENSSDMAEP